MLKQYGNKSDCFNYKHNSIAGQIFSDSMAEKLLGECGYTIRKHLTPKEMTKQYFSSHNELDPKHQMAAPEGVNYILADRDKDLQSMV